jgi:hypothetical protein
MTLTTLVTGRDADAREAAIAAELAVDPQGTSAALILEGLPIAPIEFESSVRVVRIAPGCPCCTGKLTMQVTLNRMLRFAPERLYIGVANDAHLDQFRHFLMQPPYTALLALTGDIRLQDS